MHPDLASLLRYAREYPDDDTVRLVVADWLEENGDLDGRERARFIRLQLELASEKFDFLTVQQVEAEARELRLRHLHYWLGEFTEVPGVRGAEFERGLMRLRVGLGILDHLGTLPELADWAFVDGLICVGGWSEWSRRSREDSPVPPHRSPTLAGLNYLSIQGIDSPPGILASLGSNPAAADLLEIVQSGGVLHEEAATALVSSPHLARLRTVTMSSVTVPRSCQHRLRERSVPDSTASDATTRKDPAMHRLAVVLLFAGPLTRFCRQQTHAPARRRSCRCRSRSRAPEGDRRRRHRRHQSEAVPRCRRPHPAAG